MPVPFALDTWELIAFSGLCAVFALSFATTFGAAVAYFAMREPRTAAHPVTSGGPSYATEPAHAPPPTVAVG